MNEASSTHIEMRPGFMAPTDDQPSTLPDTVHMPNIYQFLIKNHEAASTFARALSVKDQYSLLRSSRTSYRTFRLHVEPLRELILSRTNMALPRPLPDWPLSDINVIGTTMQSPEDRVMARQWLQLYGGSLPAHRSLQFTVPPWYTVQETADAIRDILPDPFRRVSTVQIKRCGLNQLMHELCNTIHEWNSIHDAGGRIPSSMVFTAADAINAMGDLPLVHAAQDPSVDTTAGLVLIDEEAERSRIAQSKAAAERTLDAWVCDPCSASRNPKPSSMVSCTLSYGLDGLVNLHRLQSGDPLVGDTVKLAAELLRRGEESQLGISITADTHDFEVNSALRHLRNVVYAKIDSPDSVLRDLLPDMIASDRMDLDPFRSEMKQSLLFLTSFHGRKAFEQHVLSNPGVPFRLAPELGWGGSLPNHEIPVEEIDVDMAEDEESESGHSPDPGSQSENESEEGAIKHLMSLFSRVCNCVACGSDGTGSSSGASEHHP